MINLRDVEPGDKDMLRQWRNLPEVGKYMFTDHQISQAEHDKWFQAMLKNPRSRYWIIVYDGEDVGLVTLYDIDERNKRCYWGRYLAAENFRGNGIGSYIEYWVLCYVFDVLQMNKLCTEVLSFNNVVLSMHKRFGFRQEGFFQEHVLKAEGFHDVVALAILHSDWKVKKPEVENYLRQKGLLEAKLDFQQQFAL